MNYAAVDYESYYDDECSITKQGTDGYILDPKFHVYLVSIVTDDFEWVGHPNDAPWEKISGDSWEWLAHNASFDERVHYYLLKQGKVASTVRPRLWHCTADLCAFSALPRALAQANLYKYKETVSKDYRTIMKGKLFEEIEPEKQEQVRLASLVDGRKCLRFWNDLSPKWPERERRLSRLSREQAWRGLRLDKEALEADMKLLKHLIWEAEQMIPWNGAAKNLSYAALCAECAKAGISAPASTAMGSEECEAWEDKYGEQFPWIDAMRTSRRANALLKKIETMHGRIREEDGRMPYQNKYFGAHTGRWGDGGEGQGRNKDSGFNSRNLPRKEMFGDEFFLGKLKDDGTRENAVGKRFAHIWTPGRPGVNLRNRIIPADGCHFPIADLSQIEPRVLWALAGDADSLALVRQGMSPYEAHARTTMSYVGADMKLAGKIDKAVAAMYQLAKARVLALGYQAGWLKFIMMARIYEAEACFDAPITPADTEAFMEYLKKCKIPDWNGLWACADAKLRQTYVNSWLIVSGFRRTNPKVTKLWRRLQGYLERTVGEEDPTLTLTLPSGRDMVYKKVAMIDGDISGIVIKYGRPQRVKLYGGLLVENITQACARDVFCECLLRLDDAGYDVAAHVHDEAVPEVVTSVTAEVIQELMSKAPDWMPSLPVASECESHFHYTK